MSWNGSSAVSAVGQLTVWVLTFVLPAAITSYIKAKYTVPEALATTVEQLEGYYTKWDMDNAVTMKSFYAYWPGFASSLLSANNNLSCYFGKSIFSDSDSVQTIEFGTLFIQF